MLWGNTSRFVTVRPYVPLNRSAGCVCTIATSPSLGHSLALFRALLTGIHYPPSAGRNQMSLAYKLVCELPGHDADVRPLLAH
jgi:hypothetical protein